MNNKKDPQKKYRLGPASKKKSMDRLNMINNTSLTFKSDVDHDIYMFGSHERSKLSNASTPSTYKSRYKKVINKDKTQQYIKLNTGAKEHRGPDQRHDIRP